MIHVVISQHFNMHFMYMYTHVHQKINKKFLHIGTTIESHFSIGQAGFEKNLLFTCKKPSEDSYTSHQYNFTCIVIIILNFSLQSPYTD